MFAYINPPTMQEFLHCFNLFPFLIKSLPQENKAWLLTSRILDSLVEIMSRIEIGASGSIGMDRHLHRNLLAPALRSSEMGLEIKKSGMVL